jgi:hypothetical protein
MLAYAFESLSAPRNKNSTALIPSARYIAEAARFGFATPARVIDRTTCARRMRKSDPAMNPISPPENRIDRRAKLFMKALFLKAIG